MIIGKFNQKLREGERWWEEWTEVEGKIEFGPSQKKLTHFTKSWVRHYKKRVETTDGDFVERSGHHSNEHVQQNDDGAPVVDTEHNVAETLSESTLISAQLNGLRVFQTEHRPVDRTKRVLQTATANANNPRKRHIG